MRRSGFTLIEVLITITIMAVLLIIAVFVIRGGEANARDNERKTDVATIAQQLETYYTSGSNTATTLGQYPGLDQVPGNSGVAATDESTTKATLRDLDWNTLRAPGVPTSSPMSLIAASTNAAQTPTISQYIYQPLTSTGALCTTTASGCRKFVIYYTLETGGTQSVMSKNQ